MTFDCPCTKTAALDALEVSGGWVNCIALHDANSVSPAFFVSLIESAESVAWKSDPADHELEVISPNGDVYAFDVKMPLPETAVR